MSRNFIDGEWIAPDSGGTLPTLDPSTGERTGDIAAGGPADIDRAVRAARRAVDAGPWGRLTAVERGRCLSRMAQLIERHAEDLAAIEASDTGKPMTVARNDVAALARYFEFYGGAADKIQGATVPYLNGYHVAVVREPHGVTGHILPWNYPAQMFGRTLGPALAMGNAVVLKPAEDACASILRLADFTLEAGFPAGSVNVVTGTGPVAGAALASHPGVDFLSFTGSPAVGQIVQKLAADHFIACTLELGGKSPHLVFADADFDAAIPVVCRAIAQNTGQTCSAGSRVLVQAQVYDRFVEALAGAFARLRCGTPQMNLDCGPIISGRQKSRVLGFIERARAAGMPVLAEGRVADGVPSGGFWVAPVLFGSVPPTSELAREEVFGPVLAVMPFEDEDEAVRLANGTDYGLIAAVWTRDGGRQWRVAKRLRCGQVFVNGYGAGAGIELPFGGVAKSGHGREKGLAALEDFSRLKTIVVNHG